MKQKRVIHLILWRLHKNKRSLLPSRNLAIVRSGLMPLCTALLLTLVCFTAVAQAQQDQYEPPPLPIDPTPLINLVTAAERGGLERERGNPKGLLETYLEIAKAHLETAYSTIKDGDNKSSERELDIYNKAIAEATKIASSPREDRRKLAKKVEQAIYKHLKTLESIERQFPPERAPFIEYAVKHARQMRSQALNMTFDSGEILKDPSKSGRLIEPPSPRQILPVRFSRSAKPKLVFALLRQEADYLTEEEDDLVRQAQEPDLRAKVFLKVAARRLEGITGTKVDPNDKKAQKKAEEELRLFGALPKLDRTGYLRHYARALDEMMVKLEDAYERNPKAKAFEKAMGLVLEVTDKQLAELKNLEPQMATDAEKRALQNAIEKAEIANQGARSAPKTK